MWPIQWRDAAGLAIHGTPDIEFPRLNYIDVILEGNGRRLIFGQLAQTRGRRFGSAELVPPHFKGNRALRPHILTEAYDLVSAFVS